ncbi:MULTISPECIES: YebC/PmpR family DNA-binding transcriptional regulator [Myxococcus]|uniref:Probable transcriptional regulatory protein BHS09_24965 n=1 Tax=Myxococcus xanthus TaxID=34 RepID=A0AAE6KU19_MYXXA|nr:MULTISPECIES: YebC/PmpR family DNA-binding transcriptional regulator [Myxococcus]QDE69968.1 transcriptional regulator [Myxococcus xanthus]QDE77247.1 transcriptional regulator [Myxococcus xanthus]QDE84629.1 transcriptional regulator [Myxococcus xanthus]QDF06448.1 transcriptional regulator [Myxococcus xanthus]WAM24042.1 YebC/PmpR family DNA-binding transcriptional regulator [Myxococcus sp. NMCA1]
MSGHNRWSKIKRQKAAMGATKGKLYSKVIKEITVAARLGGGEPSGNARLRVALAAAREANIPKDTIERAVKKGTGELEGENYEEVTYEGYGPGGVAILVECLTDNRNRTAADMRSTFNAYGGNLGAEGAVAWMFQKKGVISVKYGPSEDQLMEQAIDAGAEDVIMLGDEGSEVRTAAADLHTVAGRLQESGLPLGQQRWVFLPQNTVALDVDTAKKLLKLLDALEENDDVQNVHGNYEIEDAMLDSLLQ